MKKLREMEVAEAKKYMKEIAFSANREELIAKVLNDTYDPEYPVSDVIEKLFNIASVEPMEEAYYFTPTLPSKEVLTLTSNCNVTHQVVAPATKVELDFIDVVTKDYYICLKDLLKGDTNVLDMYAQDIIEELNRYEIYAMLVLIDAGAVARGNVFTPASGADGLTYKKAYEMKKAIRKYGAKMVLVTGANVTEDVDLMDYTEDKQRPVKVIDIVDEHIALESLDVSVNGVAKVIIDADVAYLVAVSDSMRNKPGYFVRRKLDGGLVAGSPDTQIVAKQRAILVSGNQKSVDTVDKFARGIAGVEEFGAVLTNSYCVAKFNRA